MDTPTNPIKNPHGPPGQPGIPGQPNMPGQPSQSQGRTPSGLAAATPPVSTPFSASQAHVAFSPRGPKSSPQQYKKSPANSATLMGHHGNPPHTYDSPSAAAAMGVLGVHNGVDMSMDHVDVSALSVGGMSMTGEDEMVKRLDNIINLLGKAKGRVSEAGLERLAQRTGLNKMWEDHRTPDGRITKTLVMAGHGLQLDINLDNNIVQSVTVAFPESEAVPVVSRLADRAGEILLKDLQLLPGQSPLTKTLDKFAVNLERLASLDKLSIFPGLDCQEAIAGIYESLEKLFNWEVSQLRAAEGFEGKSEQQLKTAVMCAKSGHPVMHARGQVGLSLEYWTERRLVPPKSPESEQEHEDQEQTWSILIGCKPLDGQMYHSVRVSNSWISDEVEKKTGPEVMLATSDGPVLDWLEPEPTTLPQTSDDKQVGVDVVQPDGTTKKFPNVKFVATFNPPLIVPHSVANVLHHAVGIEPPPIILPCSTFDDIFFPIPEGVSHDASELRTITCKRDVLAKGAGAGGDMEPVRHENTLYVYKPVYGQTITELPFSHPNQLVSILPTLRQYALISTLLSRSFTSNVSDESAPKRPEPIITMDTTTNEEEFRIFMTGSLDTSPQPAKPIRIDVVLSVHPTAELSVVFPFHKDTANVELRIQPNGSITVISQNILGAEGRGPPPTELGKKLQPEDLGRLLEVFEDICPWAEWIRANL